MAQFLTVVVPPLTQEGIFLTVVVPPLTQDGIFLTVVVPPLMQDGTITHGLAKNRDK